MAFTWIEDARELDLSVCYYTTKELAKICNTQYGAIYKALKAYDIDAYQYRSKKQNPNPGAKTIAGRVLIHPDEAQRFLRMVKAGLIAFDVDRNSLNPEERQ